MSPADTLKALFRDIFQCRGRDFGSPSRGVLGISDGNESVQWNAGYYPRHGAVWLGVNLEGMKYDDWPVARLIEREISRPLLLTRIARRSQGPTRSPCSGRATRGSTPLGARSGRRMSPPRRSRWIGSRAKAGRKHREARGSVWTPGGNIAAAGGSRSRCSRRRGIRGNDGLRWM